MSGNAKVNGTWQELAGVSAKVNGTWQEIAEGYTKVNGAWQQWFASSGSSFDHLETVTLTNSPSSVTFTNLANYTDYEHLQFRFHIQQNGDIWSRMRYSTSDNWKGSQLNAPGGPNAQDLTGNRLEIGNMPAPFFSDQNLGYGVRILDIFDFRTSKHKTIQRQSGYHVSASSRNVNFGGGAEISYTAAINNVTFFSPQFVAGSEFRLYGIKGA